MKEQLIPMAEETPLEANTFEHPDGLAFKQWKLESGTKTYKDRENIIASGPLTLIAEWYDREQPAAPSAVKVSKSILNYGNTLLENQEGEITGVNTNMQVYEGNGVWTTITKAPYTVTEPGTYEIRVKEISPYPPSAATSVTVHSYYTEASDPVGPETYDEKTAYRYTVKLKENKEDGQVVDVHHTDLNESVKFMLKYPGGINGTQYSFKLYHLPDMAEITDYEATSSGIIASAKEFSDFLLVIEDNLIITFKGNGGTTSAKRTEYIQYVTPNKETSLEENRFTYSRHIFNGWNTIQDGDQKKTGTHYDENAKVTLTDEGLTLFAQWLGPVSMTGSISGSDDTAYVGETLTAKVDNADGVTGLSYQWAYYGKNKEGKDAWLAISGETKNTYSPKVEYNGTKISCFITKNDVTIRTNEKTVTNKLTGVSLKQNIIDVVNGQSASTYAQPGQIQGVNNNMEYTTDGGLHWNPVTNVSNGIMTVTNPGTYKFRMKEAPAIESEAIEVTRWFTLSYTTSNTTSTSTSSSGSTSSSTGTGTVQLQWNGKSMPTNTSPDKNSPNVVKYSGGTNMWLVKEGADDVITMTIRPSSGSYGHWNINGGSYSNVSSESTITVTPLKGPEHYNIIFNRSSASPRTADESHLGLWSALCLISLTGAATILGKTFKRKKTR